MTAPHLGPIRMPESLFTAQEGLIQLRARYLHDPGCFTRSELARLRFLRWLYSSGRLTAEASDEQQRRAAAYLIQHPGRVRTRRDVWVTSSNLKSTPEASQEDVP